MDNIYKRTIAAYGQSAQVNMCIQECAELIKALTDYNRQRYDDNVLIKNIKEEVADVIIMCKQMEALFGSTEKEQEFKLNKLQQSLDNHDL